MSRSQSRVHEHTLTSALPNAESLLLYVIFVLLTLPDHDNQPFSCARLGLTPIAYLWERPQPELLREMVAAGMESRLVKVAGAG